MLISCPHCRAPLDVPSSVASFAFQCPHCRNRITNAPPAVKDSTPVPIEQTGKAWKATQLIGALMAIGSTVVFGLGIATIPEGGRESILTTLACPGIVFGLCIFMMGRIGAWWYHG